MAINKGKDIMRTLTTQPKRRYMITPRMVRMVGVKTPRKVPRRGPDEDVTKGILDCPEAGMGAPIRMSAECSEK